MQSADSSQLPTRDQILAELKRLIQAISSWDHSIAISLDTTIHQLEMLALDKGHKEATEYWQQLARSIKDERDAAQADLMRIKTIVDNPLRILNGEPLEFRPPLPASDGEQPNSSPSVT